MEKSADGRQEYSVVCEHDACQQKCQIVCNYCQVCIHMYTCTCMDFLIYHTICKHIHLICSNRQGRLNITLPATSMQDIGIPETKPLLHSSTPEEKLKKIKDRIHQSLSRISVCMASCTCENDLHLAENHVLSAVNILQLSLSNYKSASLLPIMENHPDNNKNTDTKARKRLQPGLLNHQKNKVHNQQLRSVEWWKIIYLSKLLQLFCKTHETKPRDDLQDEVIGLEISKLQHFFTEGAWLLVCE